MSNSDQPDQYELLDFGDGRKLERFGEIVLDRPAPVAQRDRRRHPARWKQAHARFHRMDRDRGQWKAVRKLPAAWSVTMGGNVFELRPSPFGHVGVFPEQVDNWRWITRQAKRAGRALRVLNLFAYTGGSTFAAAAAEAEVTHVDAAKNIVTRASQNADASGLADRPIRWITDDAQKFCHREARRGNRYDGIILDPPSYGHGARGEDWRIGRDLLPLLETCRELTDGCCAFVLATCHTQGIGPAELCAYVADGMFGSCEAPPAGGTMHLSTTDGRRMAAGVVARWPE